MIGVCLVCIALTFYLIWNRQWTALLPCLLAILSMENILHTKFVVDQRGIIIIDKGKLTRTQHIDLQHVLRIEKGKSAYAKLGIGSYLLLVMDDGKEYSIWPKDEEGFVRFIRSIKKAD